MHYHAEEHILCFIIGVCDLQKNWQEVGIIVTRFSLLCYKLFFFRFLLQRLSYFDILRLYFHFNLIAGYSPS